MVDERDKFPEDEEETGEELPEQIPAYEDLVVEEPEREVDLETLALPKTLSEEEEETEHKTDLQAAMRALIPKFKDKKLNDRLQPIMVSRIFPDNFLDLNYLLNMTIFEEHEDDKDFDFVGYVTGNQAATSIAFEGRGRTDILEIAGVAHEEELEKLSKELGI